jgi:signal transduction histidine kinase
MRNLPIKTKLICLVVFMSAVLVAVGGLGLSGMKSARISLETVYKDRFVCVIQLVTIEELLSSTRRELLLSVAHGRSNFSSPPIKTPVTDHEHRAASIEADLAEIDKTWREYTATYLTPEEKLLASSFVSSYTDLVEKGIKPGIALMKENDIAGLEAHLLDIVLPLDNKSREVIHALIRLQDTVARSELNRNASDYRVRLTISIIGIALALLAGIVIGAITIRSVTGTANLLTGQKRVLEMIATNAPQEETFDALVRFLESGSNGLMASILLLDEDGVHVRHGAAPSLPEAYIKAIDGAAIGPRAGSCGTAMFLREPVIVTDIFHDPLWEDYRDLIAPYGLRACWSTPILSPSGLVLGSFAMYYREVRSPTPAEKQLVDIATHIASIAIEHYRADQEIRKAASAAEAANRAKSQFLANMSHELRTPMAGVLGMLEITLGGPFEEEQREFIAIAHRSAESLVRILNDILEMTKIEAGMLSLEEEPFALRECMENVIDIFDAEARHKGLDLILSMTGDLPERVVGDGLRLRQVLTNLVGNAVKFTERGKVEVKVEKGDIAPSGKREFTFTVTDTGIGIPDDKKHLVFRSFRQVDESHTRKYGGTGLGLAISKEIVERMGGNIAFDCEEGVGCSFTFTVPLGEAGFAPFPETADRTEDEK